MKSKGTGLNQKFAIALIRMGFRVLICLILCAVLIVGAYLFGINAYIKASAENYIITAEEAAQLEGIDCIMVLGAGLNSQDEPGTVLTRRLNTSLELYELGVSEKMLMTGDHGRKHYDEVNAMKDYAMAAGLESSDVFMDHAGFSTYESMYRARDVFQVERMVIVSQHYHLFRSVYIARSLGIEAYGVPCSKSEYSSSVLLNIREFFARNKDFWYCVFEPLPTYLGDVIPISGNGDLTNDRTQA